MSPFTLARAPILAFTVVAAVAANQPDSRTVTRPADDRAAIVHVLNRIAYGPRPGDVERVSSIGLARYIDQQLHPERLSDPEVGRRLAAFETLQLTTRELADRYFVPALMERRARQQALRQSPGQARAGENEPGQAPERSDMREGAGEDGLRREGSKAMRESRLVLAELGQQRLLRAVYSERQLDEILVDFWFNHFNVFAGKGADRIYLTEYERDVIRPRVLGKFRDLLGAVAESPAMLFYLDNWMSADPKIASMPSGRRQRPAGRRPTGLNENYARELLELHTLGVDGGYTQKDVIEVARAFTGWTIQNPRLGGGFRFDPRMHDDGEKLVLGQTIRPGGGKKDGDRVLDIVAAHPSTARFIAVKLARRFVADEPPAKLVDRAAARFRETGGDLRETVRAILTSAEFAAPEARRAKVKTPLEFVASALRATGADVVSALPLLRSLQELGMPLYMCQPPTGYDDTAEAWVSAGGLLNRMNFAVALANGTIRGTRLDSDRSVAAKQVALELGSPEFQRR